MFHIQISLLNNVVVSFNTYIKYKYISITFYFHCEMINFYIHISLNFIADALIKTCSGMITRISSANTNYLQKFLVMRTPNICPFNFSICLASLLTLYHFNVFLLIKIKCKMFQDVC